MKNGIFAALSIMGLLLFPRPGAALPPENWREILTGQAPALFRDPESVKMEILTIYPQKCELGIGTGFATYKGYCGKVSINARNGFGGYTGMKYYYFVVDGQNLVAVVDVDDARYYADAEEAKERLAKTQASPEESRKKLGPLPPTPAEIREKHATVLGAASACGANVNRQTKEAREWIKKEIPADYDYEISLFDDSYKAARAAQKESGQDCAAALETLKNSSIDGAMPLP